MKAPLQEKFEKEIAASIQKELNKKNMHALPQVKKVTVSVGIGNMYTQGTKDFSYIENNIAAMTGQKPSLRKSKKAISNFKLRIGMPVGLTTTLRDRRMYDFLERFANVALPRVRDFRGISVKGFDGKGNYSIGIKDCTIFPEIDLEKLEKTHGLQITVTTSAKTNYEAYLLLKALGFPFRDEVKKPNQSTK
ncbi:50S ribosomal protein L5 [Patescibacteria group bacterium]|nr:50S ribosomal protein L5 [Patescibacteria group bacterium]